MFGVYQVILNVLGRPESNCDSSRNVILVIKIHAIGVGGVAQAPRETIACLSIGRNANQQFIRDDRKIERPFDLAVVEVTGGQLEVSAEIVGRHFGLQEKGAAGRIAAKQCTLRTLEDLYVSQVKIESRTSQQTTLPKTINGQRHFVEIFKHAVLAGRAKSLAADVDLRVVAKAAANRQ